MGKTEWTGKSILLVEGEKVFALATTRVLEQDGYSVLCVGSGAQALEAMRDNPDIDLVLMDIDLGDGMNGAQTAEALLAEWSVPVLFLSRRTEPEIVEKMEHIASYGFVMKNSGDFLLLASIKMALRLFEARAQNLEKTRELEDVNRKLRESEADFRSLFEASPAGIGMLRDRVFRKVNAAMCELTGYSEKELLGQSTRILYSDEREFERVGRAFYSPMITGRVILETRLRKKNGTEMDILAAGSPLDPGNPDPHIGFATVIFDITDRKRFEEKLKETEAFLSRTQEVGHMGTFVFEHLGEPGRETWHCSRLTENILGIGPAYPHTEDGWFDLIVERDQVRFAIDKMFRNKEIHSDLIYQIVRPCDGEARWIHGQDEVEYDGKGKPLRRIGTIRDITEQMNVQKELDAALHEQETLLHELQHRVKNSFSIISGLVGLEVGRAEDPRTMDVLEQLNSRIQSLSNLYDLLSRSHKASTVWLDEYIHMIVESLVASCVDDAQRICVEENLEHVEVTTKNSTAWGLIANEFLTNALKYAFPGDRSGRVRVVLKLDCGNIVLSVFDDGVKLPANFDIAASTGFGLSLAAMMAQQLGGELSMERGTKTFRVRAPEKP